MNLKETLYNLLMQYSDQTWLLHVLLALSLSLLTVLIKNLIFRRLSATAAKTTVVWDDCLIHASTHPLTGMIWITGFSVVMQILSQHFAFSVVLLKAIESTKSLLLFALLAWFLIAMVRRAESDYIAQSRMGKTKLDQTSIRAIAQISRIVVIVSTGSILLDMLGVPTTGIMTAGGIGGFAVGFAAKDLLANIFGGFVVYLDRPFAIGDWIKIADKGLEGTVEQIGWRTTMLRTFDKRALYIPNGIFLLASIENPSRMTNRRIKATVGVRFQDVGKIEGMLTDIESMLRERDDIDTTQTLYVRLTEVADSSLNFLVYCFTKTTNWVKFLEIQQDVILKVLALIEKHDAECAFPTVTLDVGEADGSNKIKAIKIKDKVGA